LGKKIFFQERIETIKATKRITIYKDDKDQSW